LDDDVGFAAEDSPASDSPRSEVSRLGVFGDFVTGLSVPGFHMIFSFSFLMLLKKRSRMAIEGAKVVFRIKEESQFCHSLGLRRFPGENKFDLYRNRRVER
jgi:hypothetical protein